MQHLIVAFKHDLKDVILYCEFVEKLKPVLREQGVGGYLEDDMAIDGGDAEAIFECPDARTLLQLISPLLKNLPFMSDATITLVFGELDGAAETTIISLH